jgi:hypothetical protein
MNDLRTEHPLSGSHAIVTGGFRALDGLRVKMLTASGARTGIADLTAQLAQDGRGRQANVARMEARASDAGGEIDEEAMAVIRRGWHLGKESFKTRLLKILEKTCQTSGGTRSRACETLREHAEADAARSCWKDHW